MSLYANGINVVLAVQNMEATGAFKKDVEWTALNGSLSMMSKGRALRIILSSRALNAW